MEAFSFAATLLLEKDELLELRERTMSEVDTKFVGLLGEQGIHGQKSRNTEIYEARNKFWAHGIL
ncbi:hypothetical protein Tco_1095371, partial [Tanacetum coccineum]